MIIDAAHTDWKMCGIFYFAAAFIFYAMLLFVTVKTMADVGGSLTFQGEISR
jgi:hypothetical protein